MSARKAVAGDGPYPLPDGWRWVKLGEVAEILRTGVKPEDMSGDEPYLGLDCIAPGGEIARWTTIGDENVTSNKFAFSRQHVLMGKLRPYLGKIALPEKGGLCSTDIIPIAPNEDLDRRFLGHWLRTDVMVEEANKVATGANLPRISPKTIGQLDIPLPPLSEQRRIAEILDVCGRLREKSEESQTELLNLEKETYLKFFNREQLSRNGVKFSNLGDVTDIVTGNTPPRSNGDNYGGELEWVKSNNLGVRTVERASEFLTHLGEKKARVAPAGSVLVTCIAGSRNSIGKCSLLDRKVAFNQQINSVTPRRELTSEFVYGFFNSNPEAVREKSTGGMKGLVSKSEFSSISIPVPSLEMQNDYACHVRHIFQCQEEVKEMEERCRELVSSVEYKAFRGEL